METRRTFGIDPFSLTALLVLTVSTYTFYNLFLNRNFLIFTDEEQISSTIEAEFPLFVDYL